MLLSILKNFLSYNNVEIEVKFLLQKSICNLNPLLKSYGQSSDKDKEIYLDRYFLCKLIQFFNREFKSQIDFRAKN